MAEKEAISLLKKFASRLLPKSEDFFSLLVAQCENAVQCSESLLNYMRTGDEAHANQARIFEKEGGRLKERNLEALHQAFSTPIDREDIYRSIVAIDDVLSYAETTVREMHLLGLPPDEHTLAMAVLLNEGSLALHSGFIALQKMPEKAKLEADRARTTERKTENLYRAALVELFDANHYMATLTDAHRLGASDLEVLLEPLDVPERQAVASSVQFILEIMKRREVYRHMSNAADRVALAGEILHDIVVKTS